MFITHETLYLREKLVRFGAFEFTLSTLFRSFSLNIFIAIFC